MQDDRLGLIFMCCHPALAQSAQVALTLRLLGGLQTPEIARAFLVPEPTMAQRLVRAKKKISAANIPYRIPDDAELTDRLRPVLAVVYLVYNEGHTVSGGDATRARRSLPRGGTARAPPRRADARRAGGEGAARAAPPQRGTPPRPHGRRRLARPPRRPGSLPLGSGADRRGSRPRAGVPAAQPARAVSAPGRDQRRPHRCRDGRRDGLGADPRSLRPAPRLRRRHRSSRSTAPSRWRRSQGPAAGLEAIEGLELDGYYPYHAARADLLSRLGREEEARAAYDTAIELTENEAERSTLRRQRDRWMKGDGAG